MVLPTNELAASLYGSFSVEITLCTGPRSAGSAIHSMNLDEKETSGRGLWGCTGTKRKVR